MTTIEWLKHHPRVLVYGGGVMNKEWSLSKSLTLIGRVIWLLTGLVALLGYVFGPSRAGGPAKTCDINIKCESNSSATPAAPQPAPQKVVKVYRKIFLIPPPQSTDTQADSTTQVSVENQTSGNQSTGYVDLTPASRPRLVHPPSDELTGNNPEDKKRP
jgi:hypothetical protein